MGKIKKILEVLNFIDPLLKLGLILMLVFLQLLNISLTCLLSYFYMRLLKPYYLQRGPAGLSTQ